MNSNSILMIPITTTLLLIITQIPCYLCQYEICRQPFQCGPFITHYPFWGGDRPASCGHPGFELINCDGGARRPLLNISSTLYRVLQMDITWQTLLIARQDVNNLCRFSNANLDFNLFDYYSHPREQNVTLYYGCRGLNQSFNEYNCNDNGGASSLSFYTVGDQASGPGNGIVCNNSVFVPVNRKAAQSLEVNYNSSNYTVLQEALASGFTIEWLVNGIECRDCMRKGGACGYSRDSSRFVCYCPEGPQPLICEKRGSRNRLSHRQKYAILGVSLGSIIILSIVVICYFTKRGEFYYSDLKKLENSVLDHVSLALKRYTYREVKAMTRSFTNKLGQGGFGSVYKGALPDGCLVAVKVLTDTDSKGEDFLNEVASISRTSHVNIVNLLGFCNEKSKRALVYEFMPNKSLDKFINRSGSLNTGSQLGLDKLYKIAVGVARGLEYLHRGCNTMIVHFDIKPQNILLDEDFCPKISDFGLAKLCKNRHSVLSVMGTRGTIGYIAPEVFSRNFGSVSHKSDVYSFGMMVLEMAGARKTDENIAYKSSESYFPDNIYEQCVLYKTKKLLDETMSEEEQEIERKLFLTGFWCIQTVPSDRPPMSKVVEMLEGSVQSILNPPKPFLAYPMLSRQQSSSSLLGTENTSLLQAKIKGQRRTSFEPNRLQP